MSKTLDVTYLWYLVCSYSSSYTYYVYYIVSIMDIQYTVLELSVYFSAYLKIEMTSIPHTFTLSRRRSISNTKPPSPPLPTRIVEDERWSGYSGGV
jgi:hypothetical protein